VFVVSPFVVTICRAYCAKFSMMKWSRSTNFFLLIIILMNATFNAEGVPDRGREAEDSAEKDPSLEISPMASDVDFLFKNNPTSHHMYDFLEDFDGMCNLLIKDELICHFAMDNTSVLSIIEIDVMN
jgi:hypothetical protein